MESRHRFVELDRGTLPTDRLARKLAGYARRSPAPALERRRDLVAGLCSSEPELQAICLLEDLVEKGPFEQILTQAEAGGRAVD